MCGCRPSERTVGIAAVSLKEARVRRGLHPPGKSSARLSIGSGGSQSRAAQRGPDEGCCSDRSALFARRVPVFAGAPEMLARARASGSSLFPRLPAYVCARVRLRGQDMCTLISTCRYKDAVFGGLCRTADPGPTPVFSPSPRCSFSCFLLALSACSAFCLVPRERRARTSPGHAVVFPFARAHGAEVRARYRLLFSPGVTAKTAERGKG